MSVEVGESTIWVIPGHRHPRMLATITRALMAWIQVRRAYLSYYFGRWKFAFQIINGKGVTHGLRVITLDWSFELCPP
jgi:hypothetical protein